MIRFTYILAILIAVRCIVPSSLFAQGYSRALTIQSLDRNTLHSASSRALGGITLGIRNDVGVMFHNPASLLSVERTQVSLGGFQTSVEQQQEQHYAPVRYYSNFSLLMENLTHLIPDPDSAGTTQADTVQRPYDNIGPNWERNTDHTNILQGLIAAPVALGEIKFVIGAGAVQYADLDHYYQNNNMLSPSILLQRPLPIFRPADNDPLEVNWSQYMRSRDGVLHGYGVALSMGLLDNSLAIGASGLLISGSSDDSEQEISRGRLTFYSNSFRLDSTYSRVTSTGTSEYSGQEYTFSAVYSTRNVTIGISTKPPMTITRTFTTQRVVDTTGAPTTTSLNGEDKIKLPWRGTIALSLSPRENLTLALEYEIRSFASTVYKTADGTETSPWLSASVLHVGAEYRPASWLALRGGIRGQAEVFEPDGNPFEGEPITFSVYSAGVGLAHSGFHFNIAYEYSLMKYQDIWGSAVSMNNHKRYALVADLVYEIPQLW